MNTLTESHGRVRSGRTKTRPAALVVLLATAAAIGGTQGGQWVAEAATPVWHVSRAPKLDVVVAASCPASISAYRDVANTFAGPPLVPSGPRAGLICRYNGSSGSPGAGKLARQTRLDQAQAGVLAAVVRKLNLHPPTGRVSCPIDFNVVTVIGLAYPGRPDVGLWYHASGCQTLDNGGIGSAETANPSFYQGFLSTINRLSPPVS